MHRIDDASAAPGGLFTEGDPIQGTPGTVVTSDWLNAVQEEITSVVEGAGDALVKSDNAQLLAAIIALITANAPTPFQTGDFLLTMRPTASAGWIACNDGSIGNAASAATTRADADCEALFTLLWNNVANTYAPVSDGRGASAAADWAANKNIGLTKMLGRALAIAGNGASLTARALGQVVGEETHTLTDNEMPSHNHGYADRWTSSSSYANSLNGNTGGSAAMYSPTYPDLARTTQSAGGDAAHNNMQPTTFLHAHIKL